MDIIIARAYKSELQKKIAELLKEFEKNTSLEPKSIQFTRQSHADTLGNETDYNYAVEVAATL